MAVELLLAALVLVEGGANPVIGTADLLLRAMIEAEEEAALGDGGDEVLVDLEGIPGVLVCILTGDAAAAEVFSGARGDEGKAGEVDVGNDGQEVDGGGWIEGLEGCALDGADVSFW